MKLSSEFRRPLRRRLLLRLYAGFLLVAFAGVALAALLVDRSVKSTTLTEVEERLSYETMMLGQMTASALFGPLDASDASLGNDVHKLGEAVHTQLSLITLDGRVVADSEASDPQSLGSQADAPEIRMARTRGDGVAIRASATGTRVFVARAIVQEGQTLGFARSSLPMEVVEAQARTVRERMAVGALSAGVLALVLGFLVSQRVIRPIRALTEGAVRIGAGDLDAKIEVSSSDEIADLADAFNQMTGNLRHTITELDTKNGDLRLVLDNVSQGLLVIGRDGVIAAERSAAIDSWFGPVPTGATLWAYLQSRDASVARMLELGWEAVCDDVLPLELTIEQMPRALVAGDRSYELGYELIIVAGAVQKGLVMISDVTEKLKNRRIESEQAEFMSALDHALKDRSGFLEFAAEADEIVRRISSGTHTVEDTQRDIHTLRGNAAVFGLTTLTSSCRAIEDEMHEKGGGLPPLAKIESLANEWRALAAKFEALLDRRAASEVVELGRAEQAAILSAVERGAPQQEILGMIRDWQFEPAQRPLTRLAEHARSLAQRLGKGQIRVAVEASEVRLDAQRWRPFWAAFLHIVRNAVDHGIEPADERRAAGKSETGNIALRAVRTRDELQIEVTDDGRGVDWDALADRARASGRTTHGREELLFEHGLSTRHVADQVSGRGIGMGAARAASLALGGRVEVTSERGAGTTVRFIFPNAPPRAAQAERTLRIVGKDS
jgi:two-component system, chemotaxis family, sensor kinase CheA